MSLKQLLPPNIFDAIDRAGISSTKQIITLSIWDLKKHSHLSIEDILLAKNIVSDSVCPRIISCDILKKENRLIEKRVNVGCDIVNKILKGGVRRGTVTEIFGESGCGKTQLALQIILNNWADGGLYICTEDLFPVRRFEELKKTLNGFDHNFDYGKNIFVEHITEASDLLSCISVRLPKLLANNKLSIIVIDSIAAPFRCESTNYIKRAEELKEVGTLLTAIAQKYNLAVLCINQVTSSFDDTNNVVPSLGLAWSNMVTTRLMIKKTSKAITLKHSCTDYYVRELSVTFSPELINTTLEFVITERGIQPL